MYTGQVAVVSNRATWLSDVLEVVDEDTGTATDLSTINSLDIQVTIKDMDGCWTIATATIANGKVSVPGPGFQWQFEDTDLTSLCAGTYKLGVKITINNFITDLVDGTIAVVEGN
jgi:protein involved in temperature-dependent protein secretion